jgi:hypothetical protein
MRPPFRTLAVAVSGAALAAAALATSCFQAPPLGGPYLCNAAQACPAPFTCDDGICCVADAGGVPECPSVLRPDGRCTDGGTPRVYFEDLDQDGYGAADAGHRTCQEPGSYPFALDAGDCDDTASGGAIHPGAPDPCDGKDNDCNGQTDEPPTCGGPTSIFLAPGMEVGAKKLIDNWFSGSPPRCLRDDPADPGGPADTFNQFTGAWHGGRSTAHVFWAQAPAGTTWDLSRAGRSFHLSGTVQVDSANYPTDWIWYPVAHPWIMLCGPAGFLRLAPDISVISLTYAPVTQFDEVFPLRGGNGWTIQPGSTSDLDAVLRQVERVEVLVELYPASGGPSFDIDFSEGVMGFQ